MSSLVEEDAEVKGLVFRLYVTRVILCYLDTCTPIITFWSCESHNESASNLELKALPMFICTCKMEQTMQRNCLKTWKQVICPRSCSKPVAEAKNSGAAGSLSHPQFTVP